jgi:hypothetical protein
LFWRRYGRALTNDFGAKLSIEAESKTINSSSRVARVVALHVEGALPKKTRNTLFISHRQRIRDSYCLKHKKCLCMKFENVYFLFKLRRGI